MTFGGFQVSHTVKTALRETPASPPDLLDGCDFVGQSDRGESGICEHPSGKSLFDLPHHVSSFFGVMCEWRDDDRIVARILTTPSSRSTMLTTGSDREVSIYAVCSGRI